MLGRHLPSDTRPTYAFVNMLYSFRVDYLSSTDIDQVASLHNVQCNKFASIPVSHTLGSPSLPIDFTLEPFLSHHYPTNVIRSLQVCYLIPL